MLYAIISCLAAYTIKINEDFWGGEETYHTKTSLSYVVW